VLGHVSATASLNTDRPSATSSHSKAEGQNASVARSTASCRKRVPACRDTVLGAASVTGALDLLRCFSALFWTLAATHRLLA